MLHRLLPCVLSLALPLGVFAAPTSRASHTFSVGEHDFLLDGQPFVIRCGEIHSDRVPREYWRDRLRRCRAMGLNAVCAYLFWNRHEPVPGKFDWAGQEDAAEFCRIAQEEGLYVILRPGPYACAEWEMGGLPWWLLKNANPHLRTSDPAFMEPATAWLKEVGRVLAPLQITHGGPILMVQVENEYGSFGRDAHYMDQVRHALLAAGFDVPLFACNPPGDLSHGLLPDLFQVVNFGRDPQHGFEALRKIQPTGPLMCGEFYPGWFDTWGAPHHTGDTQRYLADLDYMLSHHASFSIYMAHGGTTPGLWAGADRPFKPDTSSYDYDAPISEAGWLGEKFKATREMMEKYLAAGETLPQPPADNPVVAIPTFTLSECAPLFANLPAGISDASPRPMEAYDQGHGCILYRATLPAGDAAVLDVGQVHDFGWVFLDGRPIGALDRRIRRNRISLPATSAPARLDILVEAMGRVNFGPELLDHKGLVGSVQIMRGNAPVTLASWQVFPLPLDSAELASLQFQSAAASPAAPGGAQTDSGAHPAFWRGSFAVERPGDTFFDVRSWGKGVIWVNGHCLARFWNIGPTQTVYVPGPYLHAGRNEVVILDLLGPSKPVLAGLEKPALNELRPELDFSRRPARKGHLALDAVTPVFSGSFKAGSEPQEIHFAKAAEGRQFALQALSSQDGKPYASIAELDLLGADGQALPRTAWTIAYADSEELASEDGSASNAIDGQTASIWHTAYSHPPVPGYPHTLILDLGVPATICGFRYTPRPGVNLPGHIKDFRIYVGDSLVRPGRP